MSSPTEKLRALTLVSILSLSVILGAVTFSGTAAAAANVAITPSDDDAGTSGVTYTAEGDVEVDNQDTLQHVDVHLSPADVGDVGESDVSLFVDGNEYTDGFSQFSASSGTVEFKLSNSRSISDGDPVRVVVADVTNPSDDFDANVTLHDTGDAKWQTFADGVSIDTPPSISYSELAFNDSTADGADTTVDAGEELNVSTVVSNSGEQTGTYNASLQIDDRVVDWHNGTLAGNSQTTISFDRSFDATGAYDVGVETLGPTEVTVTGPVRIVDGSADPSRVDPGTTVTNQQVFVDVADVSQDGNTDTHYVEFPNALAESLSVNSVDANATSITSSPNLVDGFDGDGVDDTVKFATSGDGGGDIDLRLTVDVDVSYPDTETTYGIDARVEDSDGGADTQSDVAVISTQTAPAISNFDASNPSDRNVTVSFDSDEQLADIGVEITDASGTTVATLTESDLSESEGSGTWTYGTTTTLAEDGDYDVTLVTAADAEGNDGADGQSDSVRINTVSVQIVDGLADPDTVPPGTTVDNQKISIDLSGVSADGNTDTHYVEFPDAIASGLSVNSASVDGSASIAQSAELVDGFDGDGVDDTVRFQTDTDAGGTVSLTTTVDVSVDYPDSEATYGVDARIEDSDGDADTQSDIATIEAAQSSDPIVTNFALDNPADRDLAVSFDVDEQLSTITVELTDGSGATVTTLTESDFSESESDGVWTYESSVTVDSDGTYTATLQEAADADGNDGADGQSDSASVDVATVAIVGGSATPSEVSPGETVAQTVTIDLENVSADGNTDTHYVEFPDALADGLSVDSASVDGSASIAQSAELVDGFDGDGVADTVRFQTDADAGGSISLSVTVDVSVSYPDTEATYGVDARIEDSSGDTAVQSGVATIEASDFDHSDPQILPRVGNLTAENPAGRSIAVAFNASEQLETIEVTINDSAGQSIATLNESAFTATEYGGVIQYAATATVERDGSYTVRLKRAADDSGSNVAAGENDTVTVSNPLAEIVDGSASPAVVRAGETVTNQQVSIVLSGVSADGDTDWHYVEFPNALAGNLSVNYADANATSITSSAELVDGFDDDGITDTVKFATSAENAAATDLSLTVDVAVAPYPSGDGRYEIDARTVDSLTGPVTRSAVAAIEADAPAETASITNFELVAENRDVDAVVRVTRPVDSLSVGIEAPVEMTLDESDFDRQRRDGGYVYTADVTEHVPGSYEASLQQVSDDGTDLDTGQSSVVDVPIPDRLAGVGSTVVGTATEEAVVELDRADAVRSVTVDSDVAASGVVTVGALAGEPPAVETLSRPVVAVVNVDRPEEVADDPVTLSVTVENSSFDANAGALRMARYDESADEWVQLETTAVSSTDRSVTLQASASETSMFAITEPADDQQDDRQNDQQAGDQEPTDGDAGGSGGSPGPLALLAGLFLLGIVGAGAVAARRYYF